ncbi:FAD-dependent oxidoreductase [Devosia sediminis]|uniref:FAD-dependent oxidoreductase n=1 Tax=Devosia sediminis TaxID=2798801 RepID=A0A934MK31_9HYPH|nr:FAD-dependent oxidoreductase [Devosia sediminis]MBJ3783106.1 FAD-dependent oxidoreductase [Devosia sediminis]
MRELNADIAIIGGGVGGVAAALAACEAGKRVVMTDPYAWIGGQLTSQAVPPDEHPWIETHGSTRRYRRYRELVRAHYRQFYPLSVSARAETYLNPGGGWVSPLCHEPRVAHDVLTAMLEPFVAQQRLVMLRETRATAAVVENRRVVAVTLTSKSGETWSLSAPVFLEASETGDLIDLAGIAHRSGTESRSETGEPSAPEIGDPTDMQAATMVMALDHVEGDHTIDRPADYDHWRSVRPPSWPNPLLDWRYPNPRTLAPVTPRFRPNFAAHHESHEDALRVPDLWSYRRILARDTFEPGFLASDVTLVNWPMNDYLEGPVYGVPDADEHIRRAGQLSLSLLYWLQTEAPRPDGGKGYPGLRLRPDITGTSTGLAQAPYIREGRRIRALTTIREQDIAVAQRTGGALHYDNSVGTGAYRIDLHPTTGGANYLDVAALPFEIPLGALIPEDVTNVVAAGKTIGTTHITNGCYRVHPSEWSIGEAAGTLASYCLDMGLAARDVWASKARTSELQERLKQGGSDLAWNADERLPA